MGGVVEAAIRGAVTGVAAFNRARAKAEADHPYLTGIHKPMTSEVTLKALPVTGTIPAWLDGRYLRIGPNPAGQPNPARYHWFTGDGMVHGVRVKDGAALWYRNRWVRTTRVSKALGETPKPGARLRESAVNTNIILHAGTYWALVEAGGAPVALDGQLETIAHDAFGGTLAHAFSAHPHRDPASGELHAICYNALDLNHVYHVVVGADGRVRREEPVAVRHGPSIHDCAITESYVLVFDLPVTFSVPAMIAGYEFPYRWNEAHAARVGLLGRAAPGGEVIWCDVEPCYVYHTCNAYDRDDGRVVVDLSVHDRNSYQDFRGPDGERIQFERWVIDPVARRVERTVIDAAALEFPRMDERRTGRPYRYVYSLGLAQGSATLAGGSAVLKHDLAAGTVRRHDFGPQRFPGEFVFVPRGADAAEDEGVVMGLVVDMKDATTALVFLDAQRFDEAPLAEVTLPHRVPPGFHGNWVPAAGS